MAQTPGKTNFYDRQTGLNGPVIGALQYITVDFDAITAAETDARVALQLPVGATFEITRISSFAGAVGAAGALLTIGTALAGEQIVASVAVVAGVVHHTIVEGTVAAAGTVHLQIVGGASTGTVAAPVSVTFCGHVSTEPTGV